MEVDAECVADAGVQVGHLDGAVGGFHPVFVGGADDLAAFDAAAGHDAAEDTGVMVASGVFVDVGGAAELGEHDDERLLEATGCVKVLNE